MVRRKSTSLLLKTGCAAVVASAVMVQDASATGQDTTCGNPATNWAQEMCLSLFANSNGSGSNTMTNGWTGSVFDSNQSWYLGDQKYQNGTSVHGNVNSARNKDNVNNKKLCLLNDLYQPVEVVPYSYSGWKNTAAVGYQVIWMASLSNCSV